MITLPVSIWSHCVSWDLCVKGLGPTDTSERHVAMADDSHGVTNTLAFAKGNAYRFTLNWRHNEYLKNNPKQPWFCWQAQVDGWPTNKTYDSYTSSRIAGTTDWLIGDGYLVDNREGLLTSLVCENTSEGAGNVAGTKTARLDVYKCEVTICNPDDECWSELDES